MIGFFTVIPLSNITTVAVSMSPSWNWSPIGISKDTLKSSVPSGSMSLSIENVTHSTLLAVVRSTVPGGIRSKSSPEKSNKFGGLKPGHSRE